MEIRQIQEADLPRVNELYVEAFGVSPPPPIEYVANMWHTEPEGCLVATLADEIVGYAFSHRSGRLGYIGNLAVHASQRGEGYGKALTIAARDHLAARCDVVGLAVDANNGRNLGLYAACGFEPTLPGCFVETRVSPDVSRTTRASIQTAEQLGTDASAVIQQIGTWTGEVFSGLDFTRDLEHFARVYPQHLWIDTADDGPRGFLAYHELFRNDPWGAVRPGPDDEDTLTGLVEALEASLPGRILQVHFHTCFGRIAKTFRERGYRVLGHNTCMVFDGRADPWPHASESLFIRPWWS